jgi:hypothetical protein
MAMLLLPASVAMALAFPIAAPGTECLQVIVSSTENIQARYEGNLRRSATTSYLMLDAAGNPGDDGDLSNDRFIFNNHTSPVGSVVDLGSFPVGVELIFRLHVNDTDTTGTRDQPIRNSGGSAALVFEQLDAKHLVGEF